MSSRIELLFEDFVRSGLYLRNWSKRTERTYRQALTSFQQCLAVCGTSPSSDDDFLNKAQLEAWIIWLRKKGVSPGGCNMYIRTFNSFLTWLHEESNSTQLRLKLLPNPSKPIRGFSDNEIRSLLSFRPKGFFELRTFTLIQLLLDTGCRIEEILMMNHVAVDFDNLKFIVKGKGNKERHVPFSLELRKSLWRYVNEKSRRGLINSYVFCTSSGHKLSYRNTYRDIKNLCAKAGVVGSHVHPHAFRHHFAVTYIRRGGDIYRLSRILGHNNLSTTQLYLRSMGIEAIGENHSSLSPLCR